MQPYEDEVLSDDWRLATLESGLVIQDRVVVSAVSRLSQWSSIKNTMIPSDRILMSVNQTPQLFIVQSFHNSMPPIEPQVHNKDIHRSLFFIFI